MNGAEPLRCLHVASGDGWGGAEVSAFHLMVELARREDVRVACALLNEGALAERLRRHGIDVDVLPESTHGLPGLARRLDATARRHGATVLHSHRYKEHLLSAWVARRRKLFHLRSAHGRPPAFRLSGRVRGVGPLLDRFAAAWLGADWLAVSEDLGHEIGGVRQRVAVVPNGIPETPPPPDRAALEAAFGGADGHYVGFVGRFESVKRPDRFVRLLERLPERVAGKRVYAWMIGDGPLRPEIAAAVEALGLGDAVVLAGHREDAEALLGALDVLVIPSDHEGHPMVLLEAMRGSVPVVASRVGGIQELGGSPFLTPPGNETALVEAVTRLLREPETRAAWTRELHERFLREGSIRTSAERVVEIYHRGAA